MRRIARTLCLAAGFLYIFGCATAPTPPEPAGPYATLELPAVIRVLAIDDRQIEGHSPMTTLRVAPGRHLLRFAYAAVGIEASPEHDGQVAEPFPLDMHAGHTYRLIAKT
jgi:hypothetical protein